jgi:hypothetical protein
MFFAVIATYVTHDLVFEDVSWFIGPHEDLESLSKAVNALQLDWEEDAHHATVLRLRDGKLECVHSEIVGDDGVDWVNGMTGSATG